MADPALDPHTIAGRGFPVENKELTNVFEYDKISKFLMPGSGDTIGEEGYWIVAAFASGNACGRIEERIDPQGDDRDRIVRIGVIDEERAKREPPPEEDFAIVTRQLREFLGQ
jgi:hypothetical protein